MEVIHKIKGTKAEETRKPGEEVSIVGEVGALS